MIKIEFEGTDGAGKTTGLKYFIEQAKLKGYSVLESREVGNPHIQSCVKMRELVLNPENKMSGEAMELVFAAMRVENDIWLKKLMKEENSPDLVVSDRGLFSHLAYGDHNTTKEFTETVFSTLLGTITAMPDVVIYFDVNTETALKRRIKRSETMDAIEMKGVEFQEKVRNSFGDYLSDLGDKFHIFTVDANEDIKGVQKQLDVVLDMLPSFKK